jgi:hypothetical protein
VRGRVSGVRACLPASPRKFAGAADAAVPRLHPVLYRRLPRTVPAGLGAPSLDRAVTRGPALRSGCQKVLEEAAELAPAGPGASPGSGKLGLLPGRGAGRDSGAPVRLRRSGGGR